MIMKKTNEHSLEEYNAIGNALNLDSETKENAKKLFLNYLSKSQDKVKEY